jgi:hypothetical protein
MSNAAPAPSDIIIIDRPDRPTSIVAPNQNLRTTIPLKRIGDVGQQPHSRLEPVGLLGAAAADAARPAGAPASRARVRAANMINAVKRQVVEISQQIESDVSAYLVTITVMNAAVGIATALAMWLTGVDDPILWGAIAFLLNYVETFHRSDTFSQYFAETTR